jgi:hypothetical protein
MNQFNDLTYYSVPSLPKNWTAPQWLPLEIGFLAGRLYFPFHEYDAVCRFFGFKPIGNQAKQTNGSVAGNQYLVGADGAHDEQTNEKLSPTSTCGSEVGSVYSALAKNAEETLPEKLFTEKPIPFLREWLAIRRGGNNFKHTPMGYLCEGRPLSSNHPYFREGNEGRAVTTNQKSAVEYESD